MATVTPLYNPPVTRNPGVTLLIVLAVILTITVIVILISAGIAASNSNTGGGTGGNIPPPCNQSTDISSLIQIPDTGADCVQRGTTGSLFYIGNLGSGQFDYVVAPWGNQPFNVCIGFCTGFTGGICSGTDYNGQSAQDNFNHCMSQLSSTTCAPPLPIAARGTTLFYALSPTCNICQNCGST